MLNGHCSDKLLGKDNGRALDFVMLIGDWDKVPSRDPAMNVYHSGYHVSFVFCFLASLSGPNSLVRT